MSSPFTVRTALTALWCAVHTLQYGFHITALNGVQDAVTCSAPGTGGNGTHLVASPTSGIHLKPCVPMTPAQFGLVVAIFTLGGLTGSFSASAVTARGGRVWTLRTSALAVMIGSILVALSNSTTLMLIGRVITGLGCGLATVTCPLFIAEIAPVSMKKALGISNQLFIVIGMLLAQSLSFPFAHPYRWRWVLVASIALATLQLVGSAFVRQDQEHSPGEARGGDEETPLLSDAQEKPLSIGQLLTTTDPAVRRGFLVVIVTQLAQQLCGISPVMYFSTRILTPVFQGNSRYIALAIVMMKLPVTTLPAFLIERVGSKPILLFSSTIMSVAALLLAVGLNTDAQALSVIGILSFVAAFSVGLGPVTWVVLPEVMPKHAVTAAGSVGLAINWSTNFIMASRGSQVDGSGLTGNGEGNIFFIFSALCVVAFSATHISYKLRESV
ncbi:hypothetical protein EHS25_008211 [Saitozyma podzolica]|uniref:Major facilitator superfamily (MFS) profile domain-containing protein n=1 Tax=Saitozyma podzolica TaxID=1890683 RepID=A0A427YNV6_9TREE|nr:hypothetical protein EHS25_008211 [Saitozyma podzolica]